MLEKRKQCDIYYKTFFFMKNIIRLTEHDLHNIIENSVKRIITEIGGTYQDGQMDLFFNQDEVDDYRNTANGSMVKGLIKAEKECGWAHSSSKDMGKYTEYMCYPKNGNSKSRNEFVDAIEKYSPIKDKISFSIDKNGGYDFFKVKIVNM